jgi:hypothetical protein
LRPWHTRVRSGSTMIADSESVEPLPMSGVRTVAGAPPSATPMACFHAVDVPLAIVTPRGRVPLAITTWQSRPNPSTPARTVVAGGSGPGTNRPHWTDTSARVMDADAYRTRAGA